MTPARAPDYTIIVPAYQAVQDVGRCVHALVAQSVARERYEVIVVDDGSSDETAARARAAGADRVLTVTHGGAAAARNAGIDAARGSILLFTDSDCEPVPDWVERMVAPLADPSIDGAKGVYRTRQRSLVARFVQLEYEEKYERMQGTGSIDFVDTYSAAYRRAVFDNERFDAVFPRASGEDIEFSYRLAERGHRLVFAPAAVVFHRHPRTLAAYWRRKYHVGFWRVRMYRLHPAKAIADSHTPQSLKLQIGLVALWLVSLGLAAFVPAARVAAGVVLGLFVVTTLPFLFKAVRRDLSVALVAPFLLLLRALALGCGFAVGLVLVNDK